MTIGVQISLPNGPYFFDKVVQLRSDTGFPSDPQIKNAILVATFRTCPPHDIAAQAKSSRLRPRLIKLRPARPVSAYHHSLPSPGSYSVVKRYWWMNTESLMVWKPTNHDMPSQPTPTKIRRHQMNRQNTANTSTPPASKREILYFILPETGSLPPAPRSGIHL